MCRFFRERLFAAFPFRWLHIYFPPNSALFISVPTFFTSQLVCRRGVSPWGGERWACSVLILILFPVWLGVRVSWRVPVVRLRKRKWARPTKGAATRQQFCPATVLYFVLIIHHSSPFLWTRLMIALTKNFSYYYNTLTIWTITKHYSTTIIVLLTTRSVPTQPWY